MSAAVDMGRLEEQLEMQADAWAAEMWRRGELSWKLDPHQKRVYDEYRVWEKRVVAELRSPRLVGKRGKRGLMRCFVFDIGRRWGKTFLVALIRVEDCLRRSAGNITYATAFEKDLAEIIQPMIEEIVADAPPDIAPRWQAQRASWLFANSSRLKLVGIDKNPKGLRGRASDGFNVTEAAHVRNLGRTIGNVVYPQFQRRPWATLILESNAPEEEDHDFDRIFLPDAKARGAYVFRTIDDNEAISEDEKQESIDAVATATSPEDARREFYGERFRNPQRYVIPDFVDAAPLVRSVKRPNYAKAYVVGDPGTVDLFGLLWGYWHFELAKLVIERDWAKANAPDSEVAEAVRVNERELWGTTHRDPAMLRHQRNTDEPRIEVFGAQRTRGGLLWKTPFSSFTWWDGAQFQPNPVRRFCDRDRRVIMNMSAEHEIEFAAVDNKDPEAQANSLRTAIRREQIVIDPSCVQLREHLRAAKWNEQRTKWERDPKYGHYDLLACLMYLWANIDRVSDPNPPLHWDVASQSVGRNPGVDKYEFDHSFAGAMVHHLEGERGQWR